MSGRSSQVLKRVLLVAAAFVVAVLLAEVGIRVFGPDESGNPSMHRVVQGAPYLYGLDPAHEEISSQGLRDRDYVVPCPAATRRIMLLGDSVVFGVGISLEQTLARQLERRMRAAGRPTEVVNAGVHGWTPFNQLAWFRSEGVKFGAEVVVVLFCLNDVADPHLHWAAFAQDVFDEIPESAVPNPVYHREHTVPFLAARVAKNRARQEFPWRQLRRSKLFRIGSKLLATKVLRPSRIVAGQRWPLRLTGEDSLSIDVLMDAESAEWRWLRRQYDALRQVVEASGAELVVASVPLAYQLDSNYPYDPQDLLEAFCRERGLRYLPALPALRGESVDEMFLGEESGYDDIWHPSARGFERIAEQFVSELMK